MIRKRAARLQKENISPSCHEEEQKQRSLRKYPGPHRAVCTSTMFGVDLRAPFTYCLSVPRL